MNSAISSAGSRPPVLHLDVLRLARSRTSVPSALLVGVLRVRLRLAAGHRPVVPHAHAAPAHPEALGLPGVQVDLMLSALRSGADSIFGLAAEARSQGSAGVVKMGPATAIR